MKIRKEEKENERKKIKKWMKKEKCFWGCDRHTLVPLFYYYNRLLLRTLIMNESSFPHYILYLPSTPYYIHDLFHPSIFSLVQFTCTLKIFKTVKISIVMKMSTIWCFHRWLPPCFDMLMGLENGFLIAFYGSFSSYIFLIELLLISKDSIKNMEE